MILNRALTVLLLRAGIGKVLAQPTGHFHSAACFFWVACELRMLFIFLNGWKKSKDVQYFVTCENGMEFEFVPISKALSGHGHACPFARHLWLCSCSRSTTE